MSWLRASSVWQVSERLDGKGPTDGETSNCFLHKAAHFARFGVAVGGVFGVHHAAVHFDVEDAFAAFDEGGVHAGGRFDLSRRTGGLREVVSHAAVFDGDVHGGGR
jgi:hypothetical protein